MSPSETTAALLDWEHLNRFNHQPKGLRELIDAFLNTTEPILHELEHALQQHNEPAFHQLRHALAGAAKSVGAKTVAETCQALAQQHVMEQRSASVEQLKSDFQQTRTALVDFLAALPTDTEIIMPRDLTAKRTLLVVEDNPTVRMAIKIALSDHYHLLVAEDGAAAMALCEGETLPDAAIVDLNLGFSEQHKPSGLDIIQHLKDQVPAMVLTVDGSQEAADAALRAGAWVYLLKPANPQVLHANLEIMMARFRESNHRLPYNNIDIATGMMMTMHQLDQPEARRLLMTLAASQRRRVGDLADELIMAQGFHNTLARFAQRLSMPTDSPPS